MSTISEVSKIERTAWENWVSAREATEKAYASFQETQYRDAWDYTCHVKTDAEIQQEEERYYATKEAEEEKESIWLEARAWLDLEIKLLRVN